jgi:hypothetical protein
MAFYGVHDEEGVITEAKRALEACFQRTAEPLN